MVYGVLSYRYFLGDAFFGERVGHGGLVGEVGGKNGRQFLYVFYGVYGENVSPTALRAKRLVL